MDEDILKRIFAIFQANKEQTFEQFSSAVNTKDNERVLVELSQTWNRGGSYHLWEIITPEQLAHFQARNPVLRLGEVCGKHSDVTIAFNDLCCTVVREELLIDLLSDYVPMGQALQNWIDNPSDEEETGEDEDHGEDKEAGDDDHENKKRARTDQE